MIYIYINIYHICTVIIRMGTVFQKAPKSSGTDLEWCIQIFSREKWRKSGWIQPSARQNQVSINMLIDSLFSCSFWQIIVSESVCTSCISQTFTKHLDKSDASFWWLFWCSKKVAWLVPWTPKWCLVAWCAEVESLKGNERQHTKRLEGDPPRGNGWSDTRNYNGSWAWHVESAVLAEPLFFTGLLPAPFFNSYSTILMNFQSFQMEHFAQ